MMRPAIKIDNLIKDFSIGIRGIKLRAVENLSLEIKQNKIFGLLGPNGSGKSTTMKIIVGLLNPTRGHCEVFGNPSNSIESRKSIGFMPEAPYFYRYLTGKELVRFYARICNVSKNKREERIDHVIKMVDMTHAASRRVGTYSKGMLQRIGLAQALVHDPDLLILDEPTAGVDPIGSIEIAKIIKDLKLSGKTILLCSHLLAEVEDICDEIAILNNGRLQAHGSVSDLLELDHQHTFTTEGFSDDKIIRVRKALEGEGIKLNKIEKSRKSLATLFRDETREN